MVKVQKPTPKILSKLGKTKNSIHKKKVAAATEAVSTGIKNLKSKLIKAILNNEKILPPIKENQVKSEKKGKDKMEYPGASAASVKVMKNKNAKNGKVSTKKRPATLEPNSSAGKSKKNNAKKAKVASNAAPVPVTADIQKKKAKNVAGKSIQSANVPPKQQEKVAKMEKKKAAIKAYKKQKNSLGNEKKEATVPKYAKYAYEPLPFDEDKFKEIVCFEKIKIMAEALQKLVEHELAQRKTSIFSDYKYCLTVGCFKIPSCPKRMVKMDLKHSLVDKEDDVVIIVPDLKRGAKVDYEPTIQHYEDLFREAGIKDLKIIPFNQLKTEYTSFESLRKLSNTYDYFLCDGRLVSHVAGFCGTIFQKPRTTFHAVRMDGPNLKMNIEKSMRRTAFKQLRKGDLISIPVGTHKFTSQQLAENIEHVVAQLKTLYPGGLGNVRAMHLNIALNGTSSLPLYISMAQPPSETPYVVGQREERMLKMKKEANEVLEKFAMNKNGTILRLRMEQIANRMRLKKAKEQLAAKRDATPEGGDDFKPLLLPNNKAKNIGKAEADQDSKNMSNEPDAKDDDDEESAVLAKKSRKEETAEVEKDSIKTNADEQTEPEPDEDEPDDSDTDDDDNLEEYETEGDLEDDDEHEAPQDVQDSDDDDDDEDEDDDTDDDDDDEDQDDDDSD